MKRIIFLLLFASSLTSVFGQTEKKLDAIGIETQLYPAGTMFNVKANWALGEKSSLIGKLGYNIARRQDFGEHDKEEGGGLGFALGYKRYFKDGHSGFFVDGRLGMWFLDIDWEDNNPSRQGNSDITVFQPTAGIGYDFLLKNDKIKLGVFVAFGYEVNMVTSGEEVGQGGISLVGLSVGFRL